MSVFTRLLSLVRRSVSKFDASSEPVLQLLSEARQSLSLLQRVPLQEAKRQPRLSASKIEGTLGVCVPFSLGVYYYSFSRISLSQVR